MQPSKILTQSIFNTTEKHQLDDPILSLTIAYRQDPRPRKVNLGVGAYYTEEGKPVMLKSIKMAEKELLDQEKNKSYLPIDGNLAFIQSALTLLFGVHSPLIMQNRVAGCQTVGGTSALRLGGEYLAIEGPRTIYISDPTWPNHRKVFESCGHVVKTYPYLDKKTNQVDFKSFIDSVNQMKQGDIILLQGACHNPTGQDLTQEQWKELSSLIAKKGIFPFFDVAYQGFSQGLTEDAFAVRLFAEDGHHFFVANSHSKNFGLYGERVGILAAITQDTALSSKVLKQLKSLVRANYSSPPRHGAAIVAKILENEEIKNVWLEELDAMRARVKEMRHGLWDRLKQSGVASDEDIFIRDQNGLFTYGLIPPEKVKQFKDDYAIYMPSDGRINVAGLNHSNLEHVVEVIAKVLK